ncbi:type II toxin-antitoxin system RelE family toxin [Desulfovibrio psychrotolerans]|uniref:Uncharacterized protein n=1 Tax=Desulfovibrio psychrotolerans TaxID=415242 RepID=A0A7J0BXT2_9BACT|nr:hypothetical protein DSM19430T_31770 [Desulfovibrio psychrotolerans]
MTYEVHLHKSALKTLKKMDGTLRRCILNKIEHLKRDPRPYDCKKLSGSDMYRVRSGNFRILYTIEDKKLIVLIVAIRDRKEAYKTRQSVA